MRALRLAPADDKKQIDTKCKELLTRAEKIKSAADWQSVARQKVVPKLRHPTSKRKLTTREEIIILEGAKLNGFIFPPWDRQPPSSEFAASDGQPFTYVSVVYVDKPVGPSNRPQGYPRFAPFGVSA